MRPFAFHGFLLLVLVNGATAPPEAAVERFIASLSEMFVATHRAPDEPYPLGGEEPLPVRVEAWSFVAVPGQSGTAAGVRLRFNLRLFEYSTAQEAQAALRRLADEVPESILYKSPMLVLSSDRYAFRLDGACTFSEKHWDAVQTELLRALASSVGDEQSRLEVRCGGQLVKPDSR